MFATSRSWIHSRCLLHQPCGFNQKIWYIIHFDSLVIHVTSTSLAPLCPTATSYSMVHFYPLLHHGYGFTHILWYIVFNGYQQTHDSWSLPRPLIHEGYLWIHEVCLDFLASLSHSLCQSQFFMPAKTYNLIQLWLGDCLYTRSPCYILAGGFTLRFCYILRSGSLYAFATSGKVVHSLFVLHHHNWFIPVSCYILP